MTAEGREHVFAEYGSSHSTANVGEWRVTGGLLPDIAQCPTAAKADHCELTLRQVSECRRRFNGSDQTRRISALGHPPTATIPHPPSAFPAEESVAPLASEVTQLRLKHRFQKISAIYDICVTGLYLPESVRTD